MYIQINFSSLPFFSFFLSPAAFLRFEAPSDDLLWTSEGLGARFLLPLFAFLVG